MNWVFLPAGSVAPLDEATRLYWLPDTGAGSWLTLQECAVRQAGQPLRLVLPMEVCTALAVQLPTQKARWLRQALPYAVEEWLAEDVEQLHLALGEPLGDGRHRVLAIRRQLLADWLQQLREQGLQVAAIHCDADLLPRQGRQLLVLEQRALLGGAGEERLVFPREQWSLLAPRIGELQAAYGCEANPPLALAAYRQLDDPYRLLSEGLSGALDLAQGEFAVRSAAAGWRRWRPLLALIVAGLCLQLGFNLAQGWYLEQRGDAFAAQSRALYQQLFPEDQRIVNLRVQFDEHLRQGSQAQSGRFLQLLGELGAVLAQGSPAGLVVEQMDFSEEDNRLALQAQVADFAALEAFRQQLSDAGLAVQMGSASRSEQGVSARILIGDQP